MSEVERVYNSMPIGHWVTIPDSVEVDMREKYIIHRWVVSRRWADGRVKYKRLK